MVLLLTLLVKGSEGVKLQHLLIEVSRKEVTNVITTEAVSVLSEVIAAAHHHHPSMRHIQEKRGGVGVDSHNYLRSKAHEFCKGGKTICHDAGTGQFQHSANAVSNITSQLLHGLLGGVMNHGGNLLDLLLHTHERDHNLGLGVKTSLGRLDSTCVGGNIV